MKITVDVSTDDIDLEDDIDNLLTGSGLDHDLCQEIKGTVLVWFYAQLSRADGQKLRIEVEVE